MAYYFICTIEISGNFSIQISNFGISLEQQSRSTTLLLVRVAGSTGLITPATRTVSSRLVLILNWCLSLAPMPLPNCMTGHVRVCITCNSRGLVTSLSTRDPRLHFYWIRHRSGHARAHDTNDKTCR